MKSEDVIGWGVIVVVGLFLAIMCSVVLSGCAYWDRAIIAVDDVITNQQEQPDVPAPVPPAPEPPVVVPDEPKEPEPDCTVPPLPTQRTLERLGCLWKPVSESDRNLVVLLNREARTHVVSCEIVYNEMVYHRGRFTGDEGNGCRVHHRFGFSGGSVASGSFLVYKINGVGGVWTVAYWLLDPANRTTWGGPTSIVAPDGTVIR